MHQMCGLSYLTKCLLKNVTSYDIPMWMFPRGISKNVLTAIGLLISSTLTYLINEQLAY